MTEQELKREIIYGTHSSATKKTTFVKTELAKQAREGHIASLPLQAVRHLPQLWLSPLGAILQRGRNPRFIYDFAWSGLNKAVTQVSHKEAMRFGKSLYRFIDCILEAPPKLVPTFLKKLDLADAYMHIWVRLEDIPSVAFLVPKAKSHTRRRSTPRFPPINTHGVCRISRLLLCYYRDSQGLHT